MNQIIQNLLNQKVLSAAEVKEIIIKQTLGDPWSNEE
jgi:hypothetical protein